MMYAIVGIVIGYVLGCCQTGYFVGKLNQIDIRNYGSGNSGTTNTLRVLGKKAAGITFLGDALKGVFAVCIARWILAPHTDIRLEVLMLLAGFGAVLGHDFPVIMKFKGGKGIATTGGVLFAMDPRLALICIVIFGTVTGISKYVSLGSICMMIGVPLMLWGFYGTDPYIIGLGIVYAALAIWRHRANVGRLLHGTENKLGQKVNR